MPSKLGLSVALTADPSAFEKGLKDALKVTQTAGKLTEKAAGEMVAGIQAKLDGMGKGSSMRQAIRQFENLAAKMQMAGMEGTKAFNDLIQKTGKLKDEQQDLKALIQTGGPAGAFIAMGNAAKVAMGGVNALQGAMTLMGAEGEDLQRTMVKLQAGMAFAQGLKDLEGLKDTFTQIKSVITSQVIPALTTMKGAIAATGIGLLIVGVGMAISYFDKMAEAAEMAAQRVDNALKFADTVQKLDQMDAQIAINKKKRAGATEREIYETQKYYNQRYIDDLLVARETAGENAYKIDAQISEARKKMAVDQSNFELQEYQRQEEQRKQSTEKYKAAVNAALSLQKEINNELEKSNLNSLDQQIFDLDQWKNEKTKVLTEAGMSALSLEALYYTKLSAMVKQHAQELRNSLPSSMGIKANVDFKTGNVGELDSSFSKGTLSIERQTAALKELQTVYMDFSETLKTAVQGALVDVASAMGTAMATGQDLGKAMGLALLGAMSNFMRQLGEMFIAAGFAKLKFDAGMIAIGGAPLAIAAGAALVAASAAATAKIQKANQPARFATGGIVGGNSFMGDRVPALLNSGEMVLNKQQQANLFAIANGNTKAGTVRVTGETIVRGRDIVIAFKNAERDYNRG